MNTSPPRLASQQRDLLALLTGRALQDEPDEYLERVLASPGLAMLRTIRAWWQRFKLERAAPLTVRALSCAGRMAESLELAGLAADTNTGIDVLRMRFLELHAEDPDPLIAAVASTERALALIAHGDERLHEVAWDRDPAPVLNALLAGRPPDTVRGDSYRVLVGRELPELIAVERVCARARIDTTSSSMVGQGTP